jgi:hypothetical protein
MYSENLIKYKRFYYFAYKSRITKFGYGYIDFSLNINYII